MVVTKPSEGEHTSLSINMFLLSVCGVWRPFCAESNFLLKHLYSCYCSLIFGLHVTMVCAQVWALYEFWGDVNSITLNTCVMLTFLLNLFKMVTILRGRAVIISLRAEIECMFQEMFSRCSSFILATKTHAKNMTAIYLVQGTMAVFAWNMLPYLLTAFDPVNYKHPLPTVGWYPWDVTITPNYQLTYFLQAMSTLVCCSNMICIDMILVSFLIHITGLLESLNDMIMSIGNDKGQHDGYVISNSQSELSSNEVNSVTDHSYKTMEHEEQTSTKGQGSSNQNFSRIIRMDNELRECIRLHQKIISIVNQLEGVMNFMVLAQLLGSVFVICMVLFQTTMNVGNKILMAKLLMYLICMVIGMFIYCWFAHDMIVQSERVALSAYSCNWSEASPQFKKSLRILICRAQRPLTVTAGKFYPISRATFISLINASYAYYSVLRKINEPKKH